MPFPSWCALVMSELKADLTPQCSVEAKWTSASKIVTPNRQRHQCRAGWQAGSTKELQEVRRHLRHLQDSGPRSGTQSSHSTGQSTQQGCKVAASSSQLEAHPTICTLRLSGFPSFKAITVCAYRTIYLLRHPSNRQTLPWCFVPLGYLLERFMASIGFSESVFRRNSPMRMALKKC